MATKKIIEKAFNGMGLNKIYGYELSDNEYMVNLMRKNPFGFIEEGILRESFNKKGKLIDMIVFGLLKKDYRGDN